MEYRKSNNYYVIGLEPGDEVIESITAVCEKENIVLGYISGIGACDYVKIGLYDTVKKVYNSKELTGQMEITSLIGNITTKENKTYLHMHINVCNDEMLVFGGHLNNCRISAVGEIIINKIDGKMMRKFDDNLGLNVFDFEKIGEV